MKYSAKSANVKHFVTMLALTIVIVIGTSGCCYIATDCGSWVQLHLLFANEVSKESKIRLLDGNLEVKVKLGYSYIGRFGYELDVRVKTRELDNVVLQPDSIVVLHLDSAMYYEILETKKNHFRILYWPKDKSKSKYGEGKYNYYNPRHKIVLDKFIKVDGNYVIIDTVHVDASQ